MNSLRHFALSLEGHTTRTRFMECRAFISRKMIPASMVLPSPTSSAIRSLWLSDSKNLRAGLN